MRSWNLEFPEETLRVVYDAAERIVAAIDALPAHVASAVCWDMLTASSMSGLPGSTLQAVGGAMRETGADRVDALADLLLPEMFLGDVEPLGEQLSDDVEPWAIMRQAFADVAAAWRKARPTFRTALDFRRQREERGEH